MKTIKIELTRTELKLLLSCMGHAYEGVESGKFYPDNFRKRLLDKINRLWLKLQRIEEGDSK